MHIQLLSDTHNQPYTLNPQADLIIHAGDFGNGIRALGEFQAACELHEKPYLFVLGNHDFYHENHSEVMHHIRQYHFRCLYENQLFKFGDWAFVGGTLFSNFRQHKVSKSQHRQHIFDAQHSIADFVYCYDYESDGKTERRITPYDYIHKYNQQLNWINQFRYQEKIVVVTHFPPSLICGDPRFDGSPLNPYFINDIDLTGFSYWFAGHTHTAIDTVAQGCRVVINPLGYAHEHRQNGFRENLLIELI